MGIMNIDRGKQSYALGIQRNMSHVANSCNLLVMVSNTIPVFSKHPEIVRSARNADPKGMHYKPVGGC